MDSEIGVPGKGDPEFRGLAPIPAPKMGVGNYVMMIGHGLDAV
jgi:hypothetical protein